MDARPKPSDVPDEVLQIIGRKWALLCQQWDEMYPTNPVADDEV